ncbi:MAG: hypothetical protein AAF467_07685 [Actinomycetota bacterium]
MTTTERQRRTQVAPPFDAGDRATGFTHLADADDGGYRPGTRQLVGYGMIVGLLTVIGLQVGLFGSLLFADRFLARAEIQYRGTAWTETQDVAIQSRSLVGPVAVEMGIPVKEFEERLDAGLVPGTQILRVDYVSTDPQQAEDVVANVADAYLSQSSERTPVSVRDTLTAELDTVAADLTVAEATLRRVAGDTSAGGVATRQAAQAEINSLRARKNDLETRLLENELETIGEESNGLPVMITEPFVFEDKVFPRPALFTAVGAATGMLLGLAGVALEWNRKSWRLARARRARQIAATQATDQT